MSVPLWVWLVTIGALAAVIVLDLILVDARPHIFGVKEATRWVLIYMGLAVIFGIIVFFWQGATIAGQYFAGYITEYSLSVDNLFVFLILMTSFAVPPELQHRVLLIGVVIALILRTIMIVIGAAIIAKFIGVFFIFGAFLLFTGWKVFTSKEDQEESHEPNRFIKWVERRFHSTPDYHGTKLFVPIDGRRAITPMFLVVLAIGSTDLLFALDSIPAVFGLTQEAYIVFAVNAFALMGLRQLYFLLHGLIDRLIYLNKGLGIILLFIGVKLMLEALHGTTDLHVPEISTAVSLGFIIVVLAITAIVSLRAVKRHPELQRHEPDPAHPAIEPHPEEGAPN